MSSKSSFQKIWTEFTISTLVVFTILASVSCNLQPSDSTASMSNYLAWSKVESVFIYKDQPTTANWVLTTDDIDAAPAPGMTLTLGSDTKKPIVIALLGYFTNLQQGPTMTVSTTGTPEPTTWQWYLDGDVLSGQTISSTTVGSSLVAGSAHTLTVVGKTAGLAIDASGTLYVADKNNHKIRKIVQ